MAELGASRHDRAPRTSLNRPTGARRATDVVRVDLADVVRTAHAHDGTVNDVVLAAVTRALGLLLSARGEVVPRLVVSVPVSARPHVGEVDVSNHVGVILMALPVSGDPDAHLASVVAITRTRKQPAAGASAALVSPAFRLIGALGLLGWMTRRQRFANTFVTNVRGPVLPVTVMGATVTDVIPISGVSGNAAVAFTVLSYAGVLAITVVADPDLVPELRELTAALRTELAALTGSAVR
jgi:diacylglycerol O-acyltransferase / wax synthase